MITLYSTGCPRCKVLEAKLGQKKIEYNIITNVDDIVEYGKSHNIKSAPILDVNGNTYDFP